MSELHEITELAEKLKEVAFGLPANAKRGLVNPVQLLVSELRANSPVRSGKYRSGWIVKTKNAGNGGIEVEIKNITPTYGVFIEIGSEEGQPPWPTPIPPPKGSTVLFEGRIYPYSSPGGPIDITFKSFDFDSLLGHLADSILFRLN